MTEKKKKKKRGGGGGGGGGGNSTMYVPVTQKADWSPSYPNKGSADENSCLGDYSQK